MICHQLIIRDLQFHWMLKDCPNHCNDNMNLKQFRKTFWKLKSFPLLFTVFANCNSLSLSQNLGDLVLIINSCKSSKYKTCWIIFEIRFKKFNLIDGFIRTLFVHSLKYKLLTITYCLHLLLRKFIFLSSDSKTATAKSLIEYLCGC